MHDNDDNLDTELDDAQLEDRGDEVGDLPPEDDELALHDAEREGERAEEEAAEEEPAPAKSKTVPHARFNEVNEQLKQERAARLQLEEELARARGAQQPTAEPKPQEQEKPADFDFKAARKQLREAIYEGDDAKAEQLEEEIERQTELRQTRIAEQRATELLEQRQQAQQQKAAQSEMQEVVTEAYQTYPFLDIDGAEPNQDAIDEVVALRDLYLSRGKSAAQAIADAVAKVGPRYAEAPAAKPPKADTVAQNLEREKRIPPSMAGVGERARKVDYSALTEEEFDNLSAAERKKARGDFVG